MNFHKKTKLLLQYLHTSTCFFYRDFKEKSKFCYTDPSEHMYFMNASWAPFLKICLRLGIKKKKSVSTKKHSNYSVQDQRGNPY